MQAFPCGVPNSPELSAQGCRCKRWNYLHCLNYPYLHRQLSYFRFLELLPHNLSENPAGESCAHHPGSQKDGSVPHIQLPSLGALSTC